MALKTCIECGKEHTDTIANCPHCGFVTKEHPLLDITQDKEKKKFKLQGYYSKETPLKTTLGVFAMIMGISVISIAFALFQIGYIFIALFMLMAFPYYHHKKADPLAYKVTSYIFWIILLFTEIQSYLAEFILKKEETIYMNKMLLSIFQ